MLKTKINTYNNKYKITKLVQPIHFGECPVCLI